MSAVCLSCSIGGSDYAGQLYPLCPDCLANGFQTLAIVACGVQRVKDDPVAMLALMHLAQNIYTASTTGNANALLRTSSIIVNNAVLTAMHNARFGHPEDRKLTSMMIVADYKIPAAPARDMESVISAIRKRSEGDAAKRPAEDDIAPPAQRAVWRHRARIRQSISAMETAARATQPERDDAIIDS